jgi:hypothetical protein
MENEIKNAVCDVANIRRDLTARKDMMNQYKAEFSEQHKDLAEDIAILGNLITKAEELLRNLAIEAFDGENKKPFPGVGIQTQETTEVEYDEIKALEWCKEHDMFLMVNNAAFESYCILSGASKPEFVTVTKSKTTKATIDKDLSKAVELLSAEG